MEDPRPFSVSDLQKEREASRDQPADAPLVLASSSSGGLIRRSEPAAYRPAATSGQVVGMVVSAGRQTAFRVRRVARGLRRDLWLILLVGAGAAAAAYYFGSQRWAPRLRTEIALAQTPAATPAGPAGTSPQPDPAGQSPQWFGQIDLAVLVLGSASNTTSRVRLDEVTATATSVSLRLSGEVPSAELLELGKSVAARLMSAAADATRSNLEAAGRILREQLARIDQEISQTQATAPSPATANAGAVVDQQADIVARQLAEIDAKLEGLRLDAELSPLKPSAPTVAGDRLKAAENELNDLLLRYTEQHPAVQALRARMKIMQQQAGLTSGQETNQATAESRNATAQLVQKQIQQLETSRSNALRRLASTSEESRKQAETRSRLAALQSTREQRLTQISQIETSLAQSGQAWKLGRPIVVEPVPLPHRTPQLLVLAGLSATFAILVATLLSVGRALGRDRIESDAELEHVAGLPVLGHVPSLERLANPERRRRAFELWTRVRGSLPQEPGLGLIIGLVTTKPTASCSQVAALLGEAAAQRGFSTANIRLCLDKAHKSGASGSGSLIRQAADSAPHDAGGSGPAESPKDLEERIRSHERDNQPRTTPQDIDLLVGGWVWDASARGQWSRYLGHRQRQAGSVTVVELPPGSTPEGILLAEGMPNLLWVADRANLSIRETVNTLETVRRAQGQLVGAIRCG